jgi:hypothetical protein
VTTRALLALLLACPAAAQEVAPVDSDLFAALDPFAEPPPAATSSVFDPDAARPRGRGVELGPVTLHGRANVTGAYFDGTEPVERLDHAELELSSADLYAEWTPCAWFALLGEVELASELEDDERALEVEPELLVAEVRPLGDERLRLRAGLFPVPFGLERRFYAPPRNELVTRPAAFRALFPGTWSDLGVMAWGTLPTFAGGEVELEAGLVRGLEGPGARGDRHAPLERDENHEPMLCGRTGWTALDVDAPLRLSVGVGASLVAGHHDDDARERLRYEGYDATLRVGPFTARFELVLREVEGQRPARGWYGVVAWRQRFALPWLEEAHVAARWDRVEELERWHAALGWVPLEGLQVKLEVARARLDDDRVWSALLEVGYAF